MKRIRFIERDYVKKRIKSSTEFLTDEAIDKLLDQHEWNDYTFIFDERPYGIKTIVIDNDTGLDLALLDMNMNANQFYMEQLRELTYKNPIERARAILHRKDSVTA